MPCSRQLPAGILTAVNFKEVMTHEIWWWSSGDLLDVSADPLIEPYTYGIPRQQPSAVNELMGKEGRGDFFFSASLDEPRVVSCARDIKKIMTSSLFWFAKTFWDSKLRNTGNTDDILPKFKDETFWKKWKTSCYSPFGWSKKHQNLTFALSGCFLKPSVLSVKVKLTLPGLSLLQKLQS